MFLVLLEDPTSLPLKAAALSRIVAKTLGVPAPDAAQRVRYGGGIVARDLDPALAAKLAGALDAEGHAAFLLEASDYRTLPRPRRLAALWPREGGLLARTRGVSRDETIAWPRVLALHAYALARELSLEEIEKTGRRARPKPDPSIRSEARQLLFELDLWEDQERHTKRIDLAIDVIADDPPALYRLPAEETDYTELPSRVDSSYDNFFGLLRLFLSTVPARVVVPPTTRAFATSFEWKTVLFTKNEERDSFDAWLLQAAKHGKPFGAVPGSAPPPPADDVEDVDDASLEDPEEGIEAMDGDDVEDAPEAEEEEDPASAAVASALEHFEETKKIRVGEIQEMVDAAKELEDAPAPDPSEHVPELEHFEEKTTGQWNVNQLLEGTEDLGDEDLGHGGEKGGGAGP